MPEHYGLAIVDGCSLARELRTLLCPGETLRDAGGGEHVLPRWFFEVDSWETALATPLAPHFQLWEFMTIDVREAERVRQRFPRYVPCAVATVAAALETFRQAAGSYVHIAANGGYRSPAHRLSRHASRHCWGSAVNVYRVGDDWLDSRETIAKYAALARQALPAAWIRPYGADDGFADDHLHLDFGWVTVEPTRDAETQEATAEGDAAA
jgi:hypothetical protein